MRTDARSSHRISHLGLCVRDLGRSIVFYRDGLGMDEKARLRFEGDPTAALIDVADVDLELVYLERDGLRLELLHYHRPELLEGDAPRPMNAPGLTHLSIFVTKYDALVDRVRALGGHVVDGSEVVFDGGNRGVMALDPDGTRIELIEELAR